MDSIKDRRKALGWDRATLAKMADVDPRTLQLIELGQSLDDESMVRCAEALTQAESRIAEA